MRSSMVPRINWSESEAAAFANELDMNHATPIQILLCAECVKSGTIEPPQQIIMVSGTSLCTQHV